MVKFAQMSQSVSLKRDRTYSLPEWSLFWWKCWIRTPAKGESLAIIIWCFESSFRGALLRRPLIRKRPFTKIKTNFGSMHDLALLTSAKAWLWSNMITSLLFVYYWTGQRFQTGSLGTSAKVALLRPPFPGNKSPLAPKTNRNELQQLEQGWELLDEGNDIGLNLSWTHVDNKRFGLRGHHQTALYCVWVG